MKQLEHMKEQLVSLVSNQLSHADTANTKELGEAVDMIKDLAETIYYCTITEAMEKSEKEGNSKHEEVHHRYYDYVPMRDMDRRYGRMYYDPATNYNTPMYYDESVTNPVHYAAYSDGRYNATAEMRDSREGRSPASRRTYMESKELHQPKEKKMKDLENYMRELSQDITEMIRDASPEEKQLLQTKISTLANKIV